MRYYIADLHYYHGNLNQQMDRRGFENEEIMNAYMISRWNAKVRDGDEVVILGDFCMSPKGRDANAVLEQLNGTKYLIIGNHDRYLNDRAFNTKNFKWIRPYEELKDNKRKVILSHYPVMCYNGQYRRNAAGEPLTYMLYGHVHNTFDERLINTYCRMVSRQKRPAIGQDVPEQIPCAMINCFCMFSDYTPLTLDEWILTDAKRREALPPICEDAR